MVGDGRVAALWGGGIGWPGFTAISKAGGRFIGLKSIEAAGAPHDCLELHYAGGDKLFLPVENIELLSRYGSEDTEVALDRLGGGAWQARKAKLKQRIREVKPGPDGKYSTAMQGQPEADKWQM